MFLCALNNDDSLFCKSRLTALSIALLQRGFDLDAASTLLPNFSPFLSRHQVSTTFHLSVVTSHAGSNFVTAFSSWLTKYVRAVVFLLFTFKWPAIRTPPALYSMFVNNCRFSFVFSNIPASLHSLLKALLMLTGCKVICPFIKQPSRFSMKACAPSSSGSSMPGVVVLLSSAGTAGHPPGREPGTGVPTNTASSMVRP